jgi:hypothetical protein
VKAEKTNVGVYCVARWGESGVECSILVIFTSFSKKVDVLKNARKLAGSRYMVDEDFSTQTRRIRKEGIDPLLKDEHKLVHAVFLGKDMLILN